MKEIANHSPVVRRVPIALGFALGFTVLAIVMALLGVFGTRGVYEALWGAVACAIAALLAVAGALWAHLRAAPSVDTTSVIDQTSARNEAAILQLLDELSNLARGDLSVHATVSSEITGAIADCINYAIGALRNLVDTLNSSALSLDVATKGTQASAAHLDVAAARQSQQIAEATSSVAELAASIQQVSGNAERCADVVRHSVDAASKGADAVRRTIAGMNAIRQTIQETSKRVKQLGESSQEIGNIVGLIGDIAEQTNILALNASIQASTAGEAGRGFAVVADEVQRLSERAANATRQIDALVRTIQSDTHAAVISMERTTTDVVGGALLAENAGASLEEIQVVSSQLATLMQSISASARQQAGVSVTITRSMQVISEISTQTAEGTSGVVMSLSRLADLSTELRQAAAGFTMPSASSGRPVLSAHTIHSELAESADDRPV